MRKIIQIVFVGLAATACQYTTPPKDPDADLFGYKKTGGSIMENFGAGEMSLSFGGKKLANVQDGENHQLRGLWYQALGAVSKYPMKQVDKQSGIIQTQWFVAESGKQTQVTIIQTDPKDLTATVYRRTNEKSVPVLDVNASAQLRQYILLQPR